MKRILVAEDDNMQRMLFKALLEDNDFEVVEAPNGLIALIQIQDLHLDLILIDLFMPEKDGFETIQDIKQKFPDIKIVAVTGQNNDDKNTHYLEVAKLLGADDVLRKPIIPEILIGKINYLLSDQS